MMKTQWLKVAFLVSLECLAAGCIRPRQYRPVGILTPLQVPSTPDATIPSSIAVDRKVALPVGARCLQGTGQILKLTPASDAVENDSGPCIAFVEYDKDGKPYTKNGNQIASAEELVQKAIDDDPRHQPIIIGFVHGWKHSADPGDAGARKRNGENSGSQVSEWPPEDGDIQGFEHVLNHLYRCYYADPRIHSACLVKTQEEQHGLQGKGHVVVGIYFSWYGADISPFWPFAQQVSVYSRGGEADKVAKAGPFTDDLLALSTIAHPSPKRKCEELQQECEPLFVLVGHSYGARMLEQAISGPMQSQILKEIQDPARERTFADLVLYVNSAAPASYGMDMEQFLVKHEVVYRKPGNESVSDRPMLAALTTPADAATGIVFTVVESPFSWAHRGITTMQGFVPGNSPFPISVDPPTLYRNTLGHLQEFQSHSVNAVPTASQSDCQGGTANQFFYWVPGYCFHVAPATPLPGQTSRWNGTPYWVMSTDEVIIPDHGTIFTNRFLRFVGHILPTDSDKAIVTGVP